jgi:hypothetical protein
VSLMDELEAEHAALPSWSEVVPEVPAWLAEAPPSSWAEPPRCECGAECFPGPVGARNPREGH